MKPLFDRRTIRRGPTLFGDKKERKGGVVKAVLIKFFFSILRKVLFSAGVAGLGYLVAAGHITPEMYDAAVQAVQQMGSGEILLGIAALALALVPALWTFAKTLITEWLAERRRRA